MFCLDVAVAMGREGNVATSKPSVGAECILDLFGQTLHPGWQQYRSIISQAMIKDPRIINDPSGFATSGSGNDQGNDLSHGEEAYRIN